MGQTEEGDCTTDTIEELNVIELDKADKLVGEKNYQQALKIYSEVLQRSKTKQQQLQITDRINYIKEQLNPKAKLKQEKTETKEKRTPTEFKIYDTKFKDIIGLTRQKKELFKVINASLNKADLFEKLRLKHSSGLILYGAPGVGKSILLKGASGEFQIKMADIKVSDVMSKFVGESEHKIKEIFAEARKNQPCILFFDEIDALGTSRDNVSKEGAGTELANVITEFLKQASEIHDDKNAKVFMIGATNLPWNIDNALKRSGRFDNILYAKPPGFSARKALLKQYLWTNDPSYMGHIDWNLLAMAVLEYSPADIEKIAKRAKLEIIDKGGKLTTRAIQRVLKDKELGKSSLEDFYATAWDSYVKPARYKKQGKETFKVEEGGKFTKEDRAMYKELVNDVQRYMFYRRSIKLIRFLARGI